MHHERGLPRARLLIMFVGLGRTVLPRAQYLRAMLRLESMSTMCEECQRDGLRENVFAKEAVTCALFASCLEYSVWQASSQ
jgi:hypothetical protein